MDQLAAKSVAIARELIPRLRCRTNLPTVGKWLFRTVVILCALIIGASFHYRTTNLWALKNLGDGFIQKVIGRREIILGAFHRPRDEQNVRGDYVVIQFLGHTKDSHQLYCHSEDANGRPVVSTALIESITKAKRAANDVCSWGGFLAECEVASAFVDSVRLSISAGAPTDDTALRVPIERPLILQPKLKLVVCVAPAYIYTEWQTMITGIETWLALGASKLIFPIQSASKNVLMILKEYERRGLVILRHWPKWPVLSDLNPNGLVLSRGIEESHVNCLHFAKPFAELVAFTDIDDMLIPPDPTTVHPTANLQLLTELFAEHPQAGSLIFEHRDVQFVLPDASNSTLAEFDFNFLRRTEWKQNCKVWRMKTRVVVNSSRVDSVNMHETGIHRMGYAQIRVPCRRAHFYHLRHSYKSISLNEWRVEMSALANQLNTQWKERIHSDFSRAAIAQPLVKSTTESFEDFDRCVMLITEEHFKLQVSRCMTPHVCYSRVMRNMSCVAVDADYEFVHSDGNFLIGPKATRLVNSELNCDAPLPRYVAGNHFYLP